MLGAELFSGLLRSPNAPLTLTFLHRAFKEHHVVSVPDSQLRARLENLLDEAREERPGSYAQTASDYLALWCGPEQVLLKKFYSNEADEPVFELTAAAEHAMQWLEDLHARPFVGAESRLELRFRQLEEIALFSTTDVERRDAALRIHRAHPNRPDLYNRAAERAVCERIGPCPGPYRRFSST